MRTGSRLIRERTAPGSALFLVSSQKCPVKTEYAYGRNMGKRGAGTFEGGNWIPPVRAVAVFVTERAAFRAIHEPAAFDEITCTQISNPAPDVGCWQ
jgi:hypothetical protein